MPPNPTPDITFGRYSIIYFKKKKSNTLLILHSFQPRKMLFSPRWCNYSIYQQGLSEKWDSDPSAEIKCRM